ncbi:hypothetical protein ACWDUX_13025 [Streptomyces sp. NPDC003444]
MRTPTPAAGPGRSARRSGVLLTAVLPLILLPQSTGSAAATPAAPKVSEQICTLAPPASEESEQPTGCVTADVTVNRVPAVGQNAEVTVKLNSEVSISQGQLSIRLPRGMRMASGGFSTPKERGLDTVVTRQLSLGKTGASVTFTVTAEEAGPVQIQADLVDLGRRTAEYTAHATEEITVGTSAETSRRGVKGHESTAHRKDGTKAKKQKAAKKGQDASGPAATPEGRICAAGSLTYATHDGSWHPGRRFTATVKGQRAKDDPAVTLASGLTGVKDGAYKLCFDHDGAPLPGMWVEFATTSPYWEVVDMSGEQPYVVSTPLLSDVPAGTTQTYGITSPGALHMPAFDAFDVHNQVYDVRGSGTQCWTMEEKDSCSKLIARWAPGNTDGGYYSIEKRAVFLTDAMPDARSPVAHEAGHNLQHLLYNWVWPNGGDCPSPHSLHRATGPACGWTEGFANAVAGYAMGHGRYYYNTEDWIDLTQTGFQDTTLPPARTNPDNSASTEARVAGAMIGLWREVDGGPQATFRNMDQYSSDTFEEWFNVDRAKTRGLSVGKKARDVLYAYTIDYREVRRKENLVNGSLEDQGYGWTWDNGSVGAYTWESARTGRYYAFMGGNGVASTDTLAQKDVRIPRRGTTLLEFYLKVRSPEPLDSSDDKLELQVVSGGQTHTLYTWLGGKDQAIAYTQRAIDLSRFAGQNITLRWVSTEDDGDRTDFLMDDFSVYTT